MPFVHPVKPQSANVAKVTLGAPSSVGFARSGDDATTRTSAAFVTFAGVGFEAPRLPC